ncbi:MAG TPA: Stp1/IreP family PP2C-type Ser/Thr phosphatase [Gaiellaceae bacterium]|nr:Stp1/IreP family PP2C-type Ser/Thr phosphatase [Gaiellaceae bacterium]
MSLGAYAGATDTGRTRRRNEDYYVVAPPLFCVADGMGGAQAGEVASRLAAAAVEDVVDHDGRSGPGRVTALIQEANRRVYERASADPTVSGMGTTMTVALVEQDGVTIGHVGDSRAYLVRDGTLTQLTDDHSLVNELVKSGRLSREEAEQHPQRSVITRALGTDPDVDVDAFTVDAQPGDLFLLCSDGLTSMVDNEEILSLLERNRADLKSATRSLLNAANRGGGEDNITVVTFEIAEDGGDTLVIPAVREDDTLDGQSAVSVAETVENVLVEPDGDPPEVQASVEPAPGVSTARTRLVLTMLVLLAVAAVLLVWGLVR